MHNYTLVVEDSEGNRATQTSQATGDVANISISGLIENTCYSYQVLATNQFGGSNPSTPMEIGKYINAFHSLAGHKSLSTIAVATDDMMMDTTTEDIVCPVGTTTSKTLFHLVYAANPVHPHY